MSRPLAIACLQTRPQPDVDAALGEALSLATQAVENGAEVLALPEYCGGLKTEGSAFAPPAVDEAAHPVLNGLKDFARERGVYVIVGSIAVPGIDAGEKIRNRGYFLDTSGAIMARYDKIHLFDIQLSETEAYRESATVEAGDAMSLVDAPFGVVGQTICYDLRFPALYRGLAQAGAEILTVPAAFTKKTGEAHWHVLNRARAIENGAVVVAPCAVGKVSGGGEAYGHSLIVGPWGEILAEGGDKPGVVMATVDLDDVAAARAKIPSLSHDRAISPPASKLRKIA